MRTRDEGRSAGVPGAGLVSTRRAHRWGGEPRARPACDLVRRGIEIDHEWPPGLSLHRVSDEETQEGVCAREERERSVHFRRVASLDQRGAGGHGLVRFSEGYCLLEDAPREIGIERA